MKLVLTKDNLKLMGTPLPLVEAMASTTLDGVEGFQQSHRALLHKARHHAGCGEGSEANMYYHMATVLRLYFDSHYFKPREV
jgi:hypothetical protein